MDQDVLNGEHVVAGAIDSELLILGCRDNQIHLTGRASGTDQMGFALVLQYANVEASIDETRNQALVPGHEIVNVRRRPWRGSVVRSGDRPNQCPPRAKPLEETVN